MTVASPIDRILRFSVLAAGTAAFAVLCGGALTEREHLRRDLPPWAELHTRHEQTVIHTAAGEEPICIDLKNGILRLEGTALQYTARSEWAVADCFVHDFDRDGSDEMLLHVWKRGSFGEHQPFWRKPDDSFRCTEHLFIFDWDSSRESPLVPLWMSSQIPVKAQTITVDEAGILRIEAPDGSVTHWQWGSWGLVRVDASWPA